MLERGDERDAVVQMVEPYRTDDRVMGWLINLTKNQGDDEGELKLIKEGFAIAESLGLRGTMHQYKSMLCEYYKRTKDHDQYLALLREMAIQNRNSCEQWKEYRDQYPGDWTEERDALIQARRIDGRFDYGMFEIYANENMMEDLMDLIEESGDEFHLDKYCHQLLPLFSKRMVEFYIQRLDRMLTQAGNRNKYKAAVYRMEKIRMMPGGEAIIFDKIREYREKYRRRPAMMEELDLAGL